MGKTQSKRSVDITTETKKGAEDEITEKMEKIEDLDKKEVINGDATIQEKNESEKKDTEDLENDKDMTTEKNIDALASGDSAEQNKSPTTESPKEDGSATAEEISPLADESIKKSKKEKVKKKWSFRSISFGKKDKQKPAKNEEAAEDGAVATNGPADEKTSPETEESEKDQRSVKAENKSTENLGENGNATEQELNGQQTEEKPFEEKLIDVTANTTNNTTTTETSAPVQNDTAAVSTEKTEKTAAAAAVTIESETKVAENATVDDEASKNGNGKAEEVNATEPEPQTTDATESVEAPAENKSISAAVTTESSASTTNGDVDKVHQNGTNAESVQEVEQPKAQIEVNSNTDKASAATLDSISSTSINPPNVQVHAQDLNESSEMPDNNVVQIDDDVVVDDKQQNVKKSFDIGVENSVLLQSSSPTSNESADKADIDGNDDNGDRNVETVELSLEPAADTEKPSEENINDEPSPPPLPISPPPSQVSVFAFTNNEEPVEGSIQIEKSEPEPSSTNNIYIGEEKENNDVVVVPSSTSALELSKELTAETIDNLPTIIYEHDTEEVVVENRKENKEDSDVVTDPADVNQFVHVYANEWKEEEELPINKGDDITTAAVDLPENLQENESSLAAAVVDEITEKALEIVNQQLESAEEQNCTGILESKAEQQPTLQACDEKTTEGDRCNSEQEDSLDEHISSEFANKVQIEKDDEQEEEVVAHIATDTITTDTDAVLCDNVISSQESPISMQTINDTDKDCSLPLSALETVQQAEDDVEMISSNKTVNIDAILDEHLNPTKEFANAKDLKENVAVAEITQDLSVTCE